MSRSLENLTPLQRRIRAAATAVGMDLAELADSIPDYGMSTKRVGSIGGDGPRDAKPTTDKLQAIATATGAPVAWLRGGWDAIASMPASQQQLASEVADLRRRFDEFDARPAGEPDGSSSGSGRS